MSDGACRHNLGKCAHHLEAKVYQSISSVHPDLGDLDWRLYGNLCLEHLLHISGDKHKHIRLHMGDYPVGVKLNDHRSLVLAET